MDRLGDLKLTLGNFIEKEKIAGRSVLVGLSGGSDSVALLTIFKEFQDDYGIDLSAIHVDHNLSKKSHSWAEFCQNYCCQIGVPLTLVSVEIDKKSGLGVEGAARDARYDVFSKQPVSFVALGHHLDDQVETFIMQLMRGSGAKGLSSMPSIRNPWGGDRPSLIRPWLNIRKRTIEDFLRVNSISWVEDESNYDQTFDRNFIRHSLLPLINKRFPASFKTISRSAKNLADTEVLTQEVAVSDEFFVSKDSKGLSIKLLSKLSFERRINLLRYLFIKYGGQYPSRALLLETLDQIYSAAQDAEVCIRYGNISLRRYGMKLFLEKLDVPMPGNLKLIWHGQEIITLPNDMGILRFTRKKAMGMSIHKLRGRLVSIQFRKGGEKMYVGKGNYRKSLKHLFQEARVPPWERNHTPLIYCGDELVWIPEIALSSHFAAGALEPGVNVVWTKHSFLEQ